MFRQAARLPAVLSLGLLPGPEVGVVVPRSCDFSATTYSSPRIGPRPPACQRQFDLLDAVEEREEPVDTRRGGEWGRTCGRGTGAQPTVRPSKTVAGRVDAVDDRLDAELLLIDAALRVGQRVAMEAGGDLLRRAWRRAAGRRPAARS